VASYELAQNYPNPFNPSTVISFQLPVDSEASLKIYNLNGQLVKLLVAGKLEAGRHKVVWDGKNEAGVPVASGVYVYVLKAGDFTAQRKLVLMK
jgi:flagellar hook assembly protein FlgD